MLKINIEIADKQLKELQEEDGISAISYDGIQTSETYKFNSQTENAAEKNITTEELILKRKEKLQNKLDTIDMLLEGLNEVEKVVIQKKYIEGLQWWQVASVVKYGERHCKRIRSEAIQKLVLGLYGETRET